MQSFPWSSSGIFLPPLSEVFVTLFEIVGSAAFQKALYETAYAFASGVTAAIVIGINWHPDGQEPAD